MTDKALGMTEGTIAGRPVPVTVTQPPPIPNGRPAIQELVVADIAIAGRPVPVTVTQPPPIPNGRPAIQELVVADIAERKRIGIERYGTPLQAFNGRDALRDAYEEALDLCQYLRQALYERDGR